ncbi:MAG: hypothetical protein LAQ69_42935 [Acidobacteriia bacterium]|nr:hypothetical protein [Terriglobia bacterium]
MLAKHSKSFSLVDAISVGVDRQAKPTDVTAKKFLVHAVARPPSQFRPAKRRIDFCVVC